MFLKIGVFKNFAKFTEKHLRQSLFFNKFPGLRPATLQALGLHCNFIKKEALAQEHLKNTFFIEHFKWLLLNIFLLEIVWKIYIL